MDGVGKDIKFQHTNFGNMTHPTVITDTPPHPTNPATQQ